MNENILKMLDLLTQNEEAQKKFASIRDPEEAYALATSIHGGYTQEEFIQAMASLRDQMNQDLSEDDLATAAGGESTVSEIVGSATAAVGASGLMSLIASWAGGAATVSLASTAGAMAVLSGTTAAAM